MQLSHPFQRQPWCAAVALGAGDATKTLKAAPGTGYALVITHWTYVSTTAAAQAITLAGGATTVDVLAASITANTKIIGPQLEIGVTLPANTAFVATPAAAGPAGIFIVEGYILDTNLAA